MAKFTDINMVNVKTGFSVPKGGGDGLEVSGLQATNVHTLYHERDEVDAEGLFKLLGLPIDSNAKELARAIVEVAGQSVENREPLIRSPGFFKSLLGSAELSASIVANLLSISANPTVIAWATKLIV